MNLRTRPYVELARTWPAAGRHILAQFDDEYLAYSHGRRLRGRTRGSVGIDDEDAR